MVKLSPPLKFHGGKRKLSNRFVSLMPAHTHFVEAFAGGLGVLLAKSPIGVSEVVNDLDGELTNFWRVLQSEKWFAKFHRRVMAIPFSEPEWLDAAVPKSDSELDRAVAKFVFIRQSMAGRQGTFAPLSRNRTRRNMNEQASSWLTAIEGLPEVHDRLKRVVIKNMDAIKLIEQQDGPKTLFYLDPPYLSETRSAKTVYGEFEMTLQQHRCLLETISQIEGMFLLSGYASPLYEKFARKFDWRLEKFDRPNNAASGKSKRRMTECVWMNY